AKSLKNSAFASVRSGLFIRETSMATIPDSSHGSCIGCVAMRAAFLVGLVGIGCAGADGQDAQLDVRDATKEECPAGGSVVITSSDSVVICNGVDGEDGSNGA